MKTIALFGAGKSATCLIDYLSAVCEENSWSFVICDADVQAIQKKLAPCASVTCVQINVTRQPERQSIIVRADLVISLLPASLHILVALDCLRHSKTLLTASYVDEAIRKLSASLTAGKILFLCEMGLDPGIDHMSAMQIIDRIKKQGGKISSFRSHTGGLVAPESDDNSWHYKISWNPANVVRAGSAGAIFLKENEIREIKYAEIFDNTGLVDIEPMGKYGWYANRDSLSYIPVYGLGSAETFIRTTLRHPAFCAAWKNLVKAGLTDDVSPLQSETRSIADWSRPLLPFVDRDNHSMYESLGLFDDTQIPAGALTSAGLLQKILEVKWKMKPDDRDMILMLHEFEYELDNKKYSLRSSLVVKGVDSIRTAMAKTVGLPLGIAAKLILENKIKITGLHIPIIPEIYEPVLEELSRQNIRFQEEIN